MIAQVANKRDMIAKICLRRNVRRLELFGSAAGNTFEPGTSDIDLLVEFAPLTPTQYAEAYFGLQEDLAALLGMTVDLIERQPIRNPYFLESIDRNKELLYAAA